MMIAISIAIPIPIPMIRSIQINDCQKGGGNRILFNYNTAYAIELETITSIPEWDGKDVEIALEEQGIFTEDGVYFPDGRQTSFFIVK